MAKGAKSSGASRDIVVIGASAGGITQLVSLLRSLPMGLKASIFIVQHLAMNRASYLADIFAASTPLAVKEAENGEKIEQGHVYVCPADHHMLLEDGHIMLSRGAREHARRPAIDPLFRTAARVYRRRVIGMILSGLLFDGAEGLFFIKRWGGVTVVQDPLEAPFNSMPLTALRMNQVDFCLTIAEIAEKLPILIRGDAAGRRALPESREEYRKERPARLSCPECGGFMLEKHEGDQLVYHCHTGHRYSASSLYTEQSEAVERALWTALRMLKEKDTALERSYNSLRPDDRSRRQYIAEQRTDVHRHVTALSDLLGVQPTVELNPELESARGKDAGATRLARESRTKGRARPSRKARRKKGPKPRS